MNHSANKSANKSVNKSVVALFFFTLTAAHRGSYTCQGNKSIK